MKTERKRRVKGSVLFTVVSVMSLLIIFLMATLVLATSANKRAHKSYSTSQTQYTARTAVDSVFQAIGANQNFADAIGALSSANKGPINVTVELDGNASSMGRIDEVTVEWVDNQYFYDDTDKVWEVKDLLRITATVNLGGQSSTGSSYILKDPPLPSVTQGGGAGFVTAGSAQTSNHTSAFGGTYFNIRELVDVNDAATAYATLVYDLNTKNYLTNNNFALSNGQVIESNLVVNGNLSFNTAATFVFPYQGTGVAVWGNMDCSNGNALKWQSINVTNASTMNFNEVPYLYVDGELKSGNQLEIGSNSFPMNIFAGNIQLSGKYTGYSDIYLMDKNVNSDFNMENDSSALNSWTASVINKAKDSNPQTYTAGNIYSKGNLEFGKITIDGDVRTEGNVVISENTTIKGRLVAGGTLTIADGKTLTVNGDMYANYASGPNVTVGASTVNPGYTATTYNAVRVKNFKTSDNIYNTITYGMVRHDAVANWGAYATITETTQVQDASGNYVDQDFTLYDLGGSTIDASKILKYPWGLPDVVTDIPYDVYTRDSDGFVVEASEAVTAANMSYNGKPIYPVADFITANGTIYPEYAEREVVIGLKALKDPADASQTLALKDTQVVKTIKDIVNSTINPYTSSKYEIPSGYSTAKEVTVAEINNGKYATPADAITVAPNEYIKLTGAGSINKNVYFKPTNGAEMWVEVTDNITLDSTYKIIMLDKSTSTGTKLNFLVKDDKKIELNKSFILTEKFDDYFTNNTPIKVTNYAATSTDPNVNAATEVDSPQIFIYSEKDLNGNGTFAQFKITNGGILTGHVKAPYLDAEFSTLDSHETRITNSVYYNNQWIQGLEGVNQVNNTNNIPVFGSLNVHKGTFGNNWVLVYIDPNKGGGAPVITPNQSNWYQTIYYEEY